MRGAQHAPEGSRWARSPSAICRRRSPRRSVRKPGRSGSASTRPSSGFLEEATGATPGKNKVIHHDLDRFFGTWTKKEADAFDEALREQRQVEPEMWK